MPLEAPTLDDRTFDEIVDEARALIPRYAPEWTNHNESEPGMTLVQLFAWMTEMTLYRLNRVPERNYVKFLELLGIELSPAQPATAELSFTLTPEAPDPVIVPRGTQVAVAGGGGEPVVFETDELLTALRHPLAAIQTFDGFSHSVVRVQEEGADEPAGPFDQPFHPFGLQAREGSSLLLGFSGVGAFTRQEVSLSIHVETAGVKEEGRHCDVDLGSVPPPATLAWEYWDGSSFLPLNLEREETRAFTRSGYVVFRGPGADFRRSELGKIPGELFWIRCRLHRGAYERAPVLAGVLTKSVAATAAVTVRDEVLGGSDGTPGQRFQFSRAPVVDGTLRLEVDERGSEQPGEAQFERWEEVDDFLESKPHDPHYVLNRGSGVVRFGDGDNGRIPIANPRNPSRNVVARIFRAGGSPTGNVGAGAISELQSFVEGVDAVTNHRPAEGGTAEESLDHAKLRAPRALKSKGRAVTAEDFETLAEDSPGARVKRAKALPLVHPRFRESRIPGVVTVVVVPDGDAANPLPTETTLRAVCAHLNRHRLLTSEVHVIPPRYHEVSVRADVVARPDADVAQLKRTIEESLTEWFHPLRGGEGAQGWEFGGTIFYSDVYHRLLDTPGLGRIEDNQLEILLDGEAQLFCRDVPIEEGALLYSREHQITVSYGAGE